MTSDKRYQVFISSTFRDLVEERQSVLKAILELDHMPAGMELFPAGDASAWQLIQDVIDGSDYYVLIVGGRYGSLDEAGLGYTEKEYDHAVATKKPVIALLHKDPDNLPREKTETDGAAWEKLKTFRAKVERLHTCSYWTSAEDLKSKVIVALTAELKRRPQVGWVRADQIPSESTLADVLALRQRVAELENQLNRERSEPPPGTEGLASGDDEVQFEVSFKVGAPGRASFLDPSATVTASVSWNALFAGMAPSLISEASDEELEKAFGRTLGEKLAGIYGNQRELKGKAMHDVHGRKSDLDTVIVQLRALGLIKQSDRKRSVKDTGRYWTLTPYGDHLMVHLRALRREPVPPPPFVPPAPKPA